jgi:DNA (cytosine-5)-methyltransferase 1
MTDRPPYEIPSMGEIAALPTNGLTVLSTFSGAGGSCLGFRMAGYRTVAAVEFVAAARETYAANFPDVPIDARDVREISGADLLALAGVETVDVMEGSPPCASFSSSGKLSRYWGETRDYSETRQRTDDLFGEYVRLVGEIRPRVFVAENVAGLVRGVSKGYFLEIVASMREIGYRVAARVLDAQWLGVPQHRARVIFVGVRDDLGREPAFPAPFPYRYSMADALPHLRRDVSPTDLDEPANTVLTYGRGASPGRSPTFSEFSVSDGHGPSYTERTLGGAPARDRDLSADEPAPTVSATGIGTGFASEASVAEPVSLDGYAIAAEYDRLRPGESSDRYQNLARPVPGEPCPTVTALGGSSPGIASVTHPTERRKFYIWELRRLCGFPDDFVLTGNYAQQWERCGRAVPPPMMRAVAAALTPVLS